MSKTNHYVTAGGVTLSAADADCVVVASGGQFIISLPAASSVPDGTDIIVKNADNGSGKILAGFPADVNPKLYPNQSVNVTTENGAWVSLATPGRFKITPSCCTLYVGNSGNDANDGLTPATALATNTTAAATIQRDFDCQWTTPIIAWIAGSTFNNDTLVISTQPVGSNLIQASVYGNGVVTLNHDTGPPISIGDNGELNLCVNGLSAGASLVLHGCKNNPVDNAAGIYQHNNGLFDMEGDVTIIGSGTNCSAFFFDGPCPGASIANGFKVGGVFGDIWRMDEGGGRFTLSGVIAPVVYNGAACWATRLFWIGGTNELILGTQPAGGYASLGPSLVTDIGLLITNGVSIPGGLTGANAGRAQVSK